MHKKASVNGDKETAKMGARYLILAGLWMLAVFSTDLSAAETDNQGSFSFVVLGHVRGQENGEVNSLLDELLAEVRKLKPDVVFLTGDMIWGYVMEPFADPKVVAEDWDRLDAKLGQLGIPVYRVPGNHDINDHVTRDIYFARYGQLPQSVTYNGSLFILLNSSYVPKGDGPARKYILTKQLDSKQIDFIRKELSEDKPYDHVFLFMHHILWWQKDAPWWRDVHPLLVGRNVRAVFGGDFGPMKFSHTQRDGIDYIQSTIEDLFSAQREDSLDMLRADEENRLLAQQFDNFLYVTVDGPQVAIRVETVGAMSSGKFSPQRWRAVHGPDVVQKEWVYDSEESALAKQMERVWAIVGTPKRLAVLMFIVLSCFLSGAATALLWKRRWKA